MGCRRNRHEPSAREWGQGGVPAREGGVEGQEGEVEVEGGTVREGEVAWTCSLGLGEEGEEIRVE